MGLNCIKFCTAAPRCPGCLNVAALIRCDWSHSTVNTWVWHYGLFSSLLMGLLHVGMLHLHQSVQLSSLFNFSIGLFHMLNDLFHQNSHNSNIRQRNVGLQQGVCVRFIRIITDVFITICICSDYCNPSLFEICLHRVFCTAAPRASGDFISRFLKQQRCNTTNSQEGAAFILFKQAADRLGIFHH